MLKKILKNVKNVNTMMFAMKNKDLNPYSLINIILINEIINHLYTIKHFIDKVFINYQTIKLKLDIFS